MMVRYGDWQNYIQAGIHCQTSLSLTVSESDVVQYKSYTNAYNFVYRDGGPHEQWQGHLFFNMVGTLQMQHDPRL